MNEPHSTPVNRNTMGARRTLTVRLQRESTIVAKFAWNRPVDRTRAVHGREAAEGGSHRDHETGFRVVLVPVP